MLDSLQAISTDGTLFSHLENDWVFKESEKVNNLPTCTINFYVSIHPSGQEGLFRAEGERAVAVFRAEGERAVSVFRIQENSVE